MSRRGFRVGRRINVGWCRVRGGIFDSVGAVWAFLGMRRRLHGEFRKGGLSSCTLVIGSWGFDDARVLERRGRRRRRGRSGRSGGGCRRGFGVQSRVNGGGLVRVWVGICRGSRRILGRRGAPGCRVRRKCWCWCSGCLRCRASVRATGTTRGVQQTCGGGWNVDSGPE